MRTCCCASDRECLCITRRHLINIIFIVLVFHVWNSVLHLCMQHVDCFHSLHSLSLLRSGNSVLISLLNGGSSRGHLHLDQHCIRHNLAQHRNRARSAHLDCSKVSVSVAAAVLMNAPTSDHLLSSANEACANDHLHLDQHCTRQKMWYDYTMRASLTRL